MLKFLRSKELPASIWMLGVVSMLMDISSEMIHSLLPLYMVTSLGSSTVVVGLIDGLAEATGLLAKVFSGVLSDAFGKRKQLAILGYAMGALSKPLFALAPSSGFILLARLVDRVGKGIRGAPRDALVADIAPASLRGAAFGLRQSLDTFGAFLGPLLAVCLMLLWNNDFRSIFLVAIVPGMMAVFVLQLGVREPNISPATKHKKSLISFQNWQRLGASYWQVVGIGALFSLARFSEAFLVLLSQKLSVPLALVPLVMVAMNLVYAASAYPFGKLADRVSHQTLLTLGILLLLAADICLARSISWVGLMLGLGLWGLHLGVTQGLFAAMIADHVPADLRGTAYGFYNLVSGFTLLIASTSAGFLWDYWGYPSTFYAGACFCLLSLVALIFWKLLSPDTRKP